mgnify:CR=1 FL=1
MKSIFTSLAILLSLSLFAQEEKEPVVLSKSETALDGAFAIGGGVYSGALGVYRTHGLLKNKRLRVGYGLRLSGFMGSDLNYITAPAKLTADPAKIDTFNIGEPISAGLNASIHLGYFVTPKLMLGFNIDAVGIGFGATNIGTFISSDNNGNYPGSMRARPTAYNVLLVGDNDIGHLKSEFVIAYNVSDKLRIRAGGDFTFSEYTTVSTLTNNNDRFRYKAMMGFVGLSYTIHSN